MEDGKLKIKTVSDSPEIRNLSDEEVAAAAAAQTFSKRIVASNALSSLGHVSLCKWKGSLFFYFS